MSQPKVYEFAKEIGMETLTLMDKIREWNLPIKSHMTGLDESLITEIKSRISAEVETKKTSKSGTKKVKKKAPAKKEVKPSSTAQKVVKASTKGEKVTSSEKKVKKSTASVRTVIRRKASDKEEVSDAHITNKESHFSSDQALSSESFAPQSELDTEIHDGVKAYSEAIEPGMISSPDFHAEEVEKSENGVEGTGSHSPKRESVSSSLDAGVLEPRTRNNIVGRMDLKRVVRPLGSQSQREGGTSGASGSSSIGSSSVGTQMSSGLTQTGEMNRPPRPGAGRSLRTGFVAPTPFLDDFESADKDASKDKEEKNLRRPSTGKEQAPVNFSASEFRKREVVFQPKKKKTLGKGEAKKTIITTPKASKRVVKFHHFIKVGDLANQMNLKAPQLIKKLMSEGIMASINTELDSDTVSLLVPEFGFESQNVAASPEALIEEAKFGDLTAEPIFRTPVVTVMGHVDHGKTTLLDSIRNADVASKEAGGITQHIGAYQVTLEDGHKITFIDTPGHAAFTAMRARGANVTDIAIIVVAADDGVMPQTAEAISHAQAADVPIIVAINKMDKPGAQPDRIKQQLTEYQLVPEEWGGSTIFCPVSALKGEGIKELLEQIRLVAEVQELKANPKQSGTGIVIESKMERGRGSVATLLVKDGTIQIGQDIVLGQVAGRVRAMINDRGESIKSAGPGEPVEITGLSEPPLAGDRFDIARTEEQAQAIALLRRQEAEKEILEQKSTSITLEHIFSKVKTGGVKELSLVLKSDVVGSLEAIKGMFEKIATHEVKVKVIHSAVGGISESDVLLASTAHGLVIGFNVRPDGSAQRLAKEKNVEIKCYTIIYELIDDVTKALSGLLEPEVVETSLGRAEVRNTFSVPKSGVIAGCAVVDGKITRNNQLRLVREGRIVYQGKVSSLKRFKDDVKEVASGFECGIGIENFNDIKVGDVIEAFELTNITREL